MVAALKTWLTDTNYNDPRKWRGLLIWGDVRTWCKMTTSQPRVFPPYGNICQTGDIVQAWKTTEAGIQPQVLAADFKISWGEGYTTLSLWWRWPYLIGLIYLEFPAPVDNQPAPSTVLQNVLTNGIHSSPPPQRMMHWLTGICFESVCNKQILDYHQTQESMHGMWIWRSERKWDERSIRIWMLKWPCQTVCIEDCLDFVALSKSVSTPKYHWNCQQNGWRNPQKNDKWKENIWNEYHT